MNRNFCINCKGLLMVCFFLGLFTIAYAQTSPFIHEDGVRKSKFLTVNFKEHVFDLERGVKYAAVNQMANSYTSLKSTLATLENRYGKITLRKQFPEAVWGDVWRTTRRTGKRVKIHEWSQLFYLIFPDYVPVDSIVAALRLRPEVEYAHAPVIAVPDAEPNDPEYDGTVGTQWNLNIIKAEKAWDITKGSSDVIVAIIEAQNVLESGIPLKTHFDFSIDGESKFASGGDQLGQQEGAGEHATNVAGIVGAATDNDAGIASLGWNIRMRSYRFDERGTIAADNQSLAAAIYRALNEEGGCDVINCSFGLETDDYYYPCTDCLAKKFAAWSDIDDTRAMLDEAFAMDVIVVGSTGNRYTEWASGYLCSSCLMFINQDIRRLIRMLLPLPLLTLMMQRSQVIIGVTL